MSLLSKINIMKQEKFYENKVIENIIIPENEYDIIPSRSSGPGGQNVNKRSTKAMLNWNIIESKILNSEQKQKLLKYNHHKKEIVIYSQNQRYWKQNKQDVIKKLNKIVNEVLKPVKKRIPTRVPKRSKENRLKDKKKQAKKKKIRQKPIY